MSHQGQAKCRLGVRQKSGVGPAVWSAQPRCAEPASPCEQITSPGNQHRQNDVSLPHVVCRVGRHRDHVSREEGRTGGSWAAAAATAAAAAAAARRRAVARGQPTPVSCESAPAPGFTPAGPKGKKKGSGEEAPGQEAAGRAERCPNRSEGATNRRRGGRAKTPNKGIPGQQASPGRAGRSLGL